MTSDGKDQGTNAPTVRYRWESAVGFKVSTQGDPIRGLRNVASADGHVKHSIQSYKAQCGEFDAKGKLVGKENCDLQVSVTVSEFPKMTGVNFVGHDFKFVTNRGTTLLLAVQTPIAGDTTTHASPGNLKIPDILSRVVVVVKNDGTFEVTENEDVGGVTFIIHPRQGR